jgi:hypothetical protein
MRTLERGQLGRTTLAGYFPDAATYTGLTSAGIPFMMTRTSTGTYRVNFDVRLKPTVFTGTADNVNRVVMFGGGGDGTFIAIRAVGSTGVGENGGLWFQVTCIDKRL